MTIETQPCPFCGGTNLGITCDVEDREGTPTQITCDDCGCSGPWVYMDEPTKKSIEVVAELTGWNMRMVQNAQERSCCDRGLMKHIDYTKVSKHLKEFYECDRILIDFHTLEGKMVIHKHSYLPDGKLRMGQPTSYDYEDFESITERLKNETYRNN